MHIYIRWNMKKKVNFPIEDIVRSPPVGGISLPSHRLMALGRRVVCTTPFIITRYTSESSHTHIWKPFECGKPHVSQSICKHLLSFFFPPGFPQHKFNDNVTEYIYTTTTVCHTVTNLNLNDWPTHAHIPSDIINQNLHSACSTLYNELSLFGVCIFASKTFIYFVVILSKN